MTTARGDSGLGCIKFEHFIEAIQEYKRPYTPSEIATMRQPYKLWAEQGRLGRYSIPGLFEIEMDAVEVNHFAKANGGAFAMSLKPQGNSEAINLSVSAIGFMAGDVVSECNDAPAQGCVGEEWLFVGPKATVTYFFSGSDLLGRSPSISVGGSSLCSRSATDYFPVDDGAVDSMKRLLRGPRIP